MRLRELACTGLRSRHFRPIIRNVLPPEIGEDLLEIERQFSPEGEAHDRDIFTKKLVVFEGMANSRFPELSARHRFMGRDQAIERPLREPERNVWQGRGIWNGAQELGAPR